MVWPTSTTQHGKHYYFTSKENFANGVAEGKFLEWWVQFGGAC